MKRHFGLVACVFLAAVATISARLVSFPSLAEMSEGADWVVLATPMEQRI